MNLTLRLLQTERLTNGDQWQVTYSDLLLFLTGPISLLRGVY